MSAQNLRNAFDSLILSASGWRKVFAQSGNEEDPKPEIGEANTVIAEYMALSFSHWLSSIHLEACELIVATDSRPTGKEIAEAMLRVLLSRGHRIRFCGIAAAPEIMAYARGRCPFLYISASHNPIGHNGVKFGLTDGGVIGGMESAELIRIFKSLFEQRLNSSSQIEVYAKVPERIYADTSRFKQEGERAYREFTAEVASGSMVESEQRAFLSQIRASCQALSEGGKPVTLVADFNGSARAVSIDKPTFEDLGIDFFAINDTAGSIVHRIVPEGSSLDYCANEIISLRDQQPALRESSLILGYMPDCDGDRGNIVFWDDSKQTVRVLEAQEVFALSVIAELTHIAWLERKQTGASKKISPVAVAVNDPTSLRIEEIAECFNALVARAEVGEANVVNLARKLRSEGYTVRILGEGSNGGTITHPAAVRDPINTIFAILKLFLVRNEGKSQGLFSLWCDASGQSHAYTDTFTLADILNTLPRYSTTSVYEKEAIVSIRTTDHGLLKKAFQAVFTREWELKKTELKNIFQIDSWKAMAYNGMVEKTVTDFSESARGGFKVQFYDDNSRPLAYIWMRGSGTEPVFRILADVKSPDRQKEQYLLAWLTAMVLEADKQSSVVST